MRNVVWWGLAAGCAVAWTSGAQAQTSARDPAPAFAAHVLASNDHGGRPFAIVDKNNAWIVVHRADGTVAGSARVLLGAARGDWTLPGVGQRTQNGTLRPEDLTTPAGRFVAQPGHNHTGETVVWVDIDAAFAIHRLRPGPREAERARRLSTHGADDKRVSAGCVVVAGRFFDEIVQPVLGGGPAVVYVLPEAVDWRSFWHVLRERATS
jgi:hypothetical protein